MEKTVKINPVVFNDQEKDLLKQSVDLSIETASNMIKQVSIEDKPKIREVVQALLNLSNKVSNLD